MDNTAWSATRDNWAQQINDDITYILIHAVGLYIWFLLLVALLLLKGLSLLYIISEGVSNVLNPCNLPKTAKTGVKYKDDVFNIYHTIYFLIKIKDNTCLIIFLIKIDLMIYYFFSKISFFIKELDH
ncbi:hypothetical protein ACJX0J_025286, partial [Zea mays]